MTLYNLIIYLTLFVSVIVSLFLGFVFLMCYSFIKPIFSAKMGKAKAIGLSYNKDGSATISNLKRKDKTFFDKTGEVFQEYKITGGELHPEFHILSGLRLFCKRENDLTVLDSSGKPAPLDPAWLRLFVERDRERTLLRKKLFKKKAFEIPITYLLIAVVGIVVAYIAYTFFFAA